MDEEEWLVSDDPEAMLQLVKEIISNREARLFGCACCRRAWTLLRDPRSRKAVECTELYADGLIDKEQLSTARAEADEVHWNRFLKGRPRGIEPEERKAAAAAEAVRFVASATDRPTELLHKISLAIQCARQAEMHEQESDSQLIQGCILRDIFGNPFRPVEFDAAWRTTDVLLLARGIYEERAFDRMPILADALQDAGCDSDDILGHLRDPHATHVRGCWALDLVLGKE